MQSLPLGLRRAEKEALRHLRVSRDVWASEGKRGKRSKVSVPSAKPSTRGNG